MRHFISRSLIMAELQLQHEVDPQLLNGGDLNEEKEDADAPESVKKKRRKKKRSRTSAPGERHHFAGLEDRGGGEKKKRRRRIALKLSPPVPHDVERICGTGDLFNLSEDVPVQLSQLCTSGNGTVSVNRNVAS